VTYKASGQLLVQGAQGFVAVRNAFGQWLDLCGKGDSSGRFAVDFAWVRSVHKDRSALVVAAADTECQIFQGTETWVEIILR
jgi:hypothetical protein